MVALASVGVHHHFPIFLALKPFHTKEPLKNSFDFILSDVYLHLVVTSPNSDEQKDLTLGDC